MDKAAAIDSGEALVDLGCDAEKMPGVRAAQANDQHAAEQAGRSDDARVLARGVRVIGSEPA